MDLPPLQKIICKRLSLGLMSLPVQIATNTKQQQDQRRPQPFTKDRKQRKTSRQSQGEPEPRRQMTPDYDAREPKDQRPEQGTGR